MIILDTNVVSELMRSRPEPLVSRSMAAQRRRSLYLTTLTCAEILRGIALMPEGRRRCVLATQAEGLFKEDFDGCILGFDFLAAEAYAALVARRVAAGRPIGTLDAMIAAVALAHGATIATRDAGFAGCGVTLVNPWSEG